MSKGRRPRSTDGKADSSRICAVSDAPTRVQRHNTCDRYEGQLIPIRLSQIAFSRYSESS